jgi:hypothetical protein
LSSGADAVEQIIFYLAPKITDDEWKTMNDCDYEWLRLISIVAVLPDST